MSSGPSTTEESHADASLGAGATGDGVVPRIDSVETIASTKWLALQTMQYTDRNGHHRQWDLATRTTKSPDPNRPDAVVIIPLLRHPDSDVVETLLVEQYRPPVRRRTVEFPAGLVDAHETVHQAALRELREETGYVGEACRRTPPIVSPIPCAMSPGLCDESVQVVVVEVDLSNPYNHGTPRPQLDPGEHCVVQRVRLQDGIRQILDQGTAMPIMGLYLFALGWELGASSTTALKKTDNDGADR